MIVLKQLETEDAVKYLFGLNDGNTIETLYMCDRERQLTYHSTVCVSSQAGCAMKCRFCATGEGGLIRNLTAEEIFEQVNICDQNCRQGGYFPLDAVVFAGMGEPLLNYDHVLIAIELIKNRLGLRKFELATVGIVPNIRRLAEDAAKIGVNVRLNLSLHAPTDKKRARLIPMTTTYGVNEILAAGKYYADITGSRVRLRYMLIKGFNDTPDDLEQLSRLLAGKNMKLVLSGYNDNHISGLKAPDRLDVLDFYNKIKDKAECDIFRNFGGEIRGGCGQLRRNEKIS